MRFELPPPLEATIREKVESGEYPDAAAVIAEALQVLQERDDLRRLRAAVKVGLDQIERGESVRYTPTVRAEIRRAAEAKHRAGRQPKADVVP